MKFDFHMHFEYGDYDEAWAEGFFEAARGRGIDGIGITEHSHTFPEFRELYYEDLILDDSYVGTFQQGWLKRNKFKHGIRDYFDFMAKLQKRHDVRIGIEVCNFRDQDKVREILAPYAFDYVIGSVHFLAGWAYDSSEIKEEWGRRDLREIYGQYAEEVERLAASGLYDVLGHPFNIRLFRCLPDFDVTPFLERVAKALQRAGMGIDVNTGTYYRYPIREISPYPDFLRMAADYGLPIITSSDAHRPEDCGSYIDDAIAYARQFGYREQMRFSRRQREMLPLG